MNIAIDAINLRSDGGKTHLLEIIKYFELSNINNKKVFLFCDKEIKKLAKNNTNIEIIDLPQITNFWLFGIIWQTFFLSKLVKKKNCSVLFNLNGTYIGNFKNVVTITSFLLGKFRAATYIQFDQHSDIPYHWLQQATHSKWLKGLYENIYLFGHHTHETEQALQSFWDTSAEISHLNSLRNIGVFADEETYGFDLAAAFPAIILSLDF